MRSGGSSGAAVGAAVAASGASGVAVAGAVGASGVVAALAGAVGPWAAGGLPQAVSSRATTASRVNSGNSFGLLI
ncbi:hypothetical protein HC891_02340 [Candidatus Gracilibacteria bacterium]|nr:hypothetical protein [Candidatus Gracilibacteria bacterium]